jgi:MoaA/NifB/PqqE/SkfB family radical SAM enzyme
MDLAKEMGFHEVIVFPAFPSGRLKGVKTKPSKAGFWKLKGLVDSYLDKPEYPGIYSYPWISSSYSLGCQGGKKYVYISPYGDVLHCDFKNRKYGNILETPMDEILENIAKMPGGCGGCAAFEG